MQQENKMGYMPVNKLVFSMSLPMIISMLVQALYNVVDSMFVSRISENALTAVSISFPAQNLMIGIATGTAVGVNALLSRSLGEKNSAKANSVAENGVFLSIIGYAVSLIFGLFAANAFLKLQTNITEIIDYGTDYLTICCCFSFGLFTQIMFERLMQSTGRTIYTMFTQSIGAFINIILDPILIFGYFGMPKMDVKGAAIATVIGQIIAAVIAIILNRKFNKDIHLNFRSFKPDIKIIGRIYAIGIPSIIMVAIGSIMNFSINKIVIAYTATAAAVFGVYFKLQSFVFMPVFGLNNGIIPIIAYNYGAQKRNRMIKTIKIAMIYALSFMTIGLILMQSIPDKLLEIFDASENMLNIGIPALRIISISFIFAGICIVFGSVFQALGHGLFSMLVAIARQLVVLVPVAYLLSRIFPADVTKVWLAFPIAEISSIIISTFFFLRLYKKTISKIPAE